MSKQLTEKSITCTHCCFDIGDRDMLIYYNGQPYCEWCYYCILIQKNEQHV